VAKYEIFIKPSARKELQCVGTKRDRQKIVAVIQGLAFEPDQLEARNLLVQITAFVFAWVITESFMKL